MSRFNQLMDVNVNIGEEKEKSVSINKANVVACRKNSESTASLVLIGLRGELRLVTPFDDFIKEFNGTDPERANELMDVSVMMTAEERERHNDFMVCINKANVVTVRKNSQNTASLLIAGFGNELRLDTPHDEFMKAFNGTFFDIDNLPVVDKENDRN